MFALTTATLDTSKLALLSTKATGLLIQSAVLPLLLVSRSDWDSYGWSVSQLVRLLLSAVTF